MQIAEAESRLREQIYTQSFSTPVAAASSPTTTATAAATPSPTVVKKKVIKSKI